MVAAGMGSVLLGAKVVDGTIKSSREGCPIKHLPPDAAEEWGAGIRCRRRQRTAHAGRQGPSASEPRELLDGAAPPGPRTGQPAEQGGELLDLVGREVLQEQLADAGHVGAAGVAELLVALIGELGVGDAGVVGAGHAL